MATPNKKKKCAPERRSAPAAARQVTSAKAEVRYARKRRSGGGVNRKRFNITRHFAKLRIRAAALGAATAALRFAPFGFAKRGRYVLRPAATATALACAPEGAERRRCARQRPRFTASLRACSGAYRQRAAREGNGNERAQKPGNGKINGNSAKHWPAAASGRAQHQRPAHPAVLPCGVALRCSCPARQARFPSAPHAGLPKKPEQKQQPKRVWQAVQAVVSALHRTCQRALSARRQGCASPLRALDRTAASGGAQVDSY